ncbi:MAG: DUF2892 domain-containing protein [Sphingomicrobium sp.]
MDRNIGPEDRVVRIIVALGLAALVYFGYLEGTAGIIATVVAVYLLITGLVVRCLVYKLVGVDTSVQENSYTVSDDNAGF